MTDAVEEKILAFIREMKPQHAKSIGPDTDLIGSGILDFARGPAARDVSVETVCRDAAGARADSGQSQERGNDREGGRGAARMRDTRDRPAEPILEVRPLSESPDAVALFIRSVYDTHDHGSSFVPRWTGAYLASVVFDHPGRTPDHTLGAYLGDRLVGVLLSYPHTIDFKGERLDGAFASWLAVTPEGKRQFAALALVSELRGRLSARGAHFIVGVTYRSGAGSGLDFWSAFAKACPGDVQVGPELKFWVRVTDGRLLAQAAKSTLIQVGAQLARIRPPWRPADARFVRPAEPADFDACRALFAASSAEAKTVPQDYELTSVRDAVSGPQTLVLDRGHGIEAVATYQILSMEDAAPLRVGMIDHLLGPSDSDEIGTLVNEILWRLRTSGVSLALLPRAPDLRYGRLLRSRFFPYPEAFEMIYMRLTSRAPERLSASFELPVR